MSEPLAEHLSRFTPDGTGLDRDALLFAAGRASVRPSRPWIALAGALAASQLLTFVYLWPRTPQPPSVPFALPGTAAVAPAEPLAAHDPSELGTLRDRLLASEDDWPTPPSAEPTVPPEPPLRAFGMPPSTILN
jgi:hypothetical protein